MKPQRSESCLAAMSPGRPFHAEGRLAARSDTLAEGTGSSLFCSSQWFGATTSTLVPATRSHCGERPRDRDAERASSISGYDRSRPLTHSLTHLRDEVPGAPLPSKLEVFVWTKATEGLCPQPAHVWTASGADGRQPVAPASTLPRVS